MESSRRIQSYSVVGTWPSAVARVMSGTRIGRWREDLLPRTHIMAERRVAKDSRHLSQPTTVYRIWLLLIVQYYCVVVTTSALLRNQRLD